MKTKRNLFILIAVFTFFSCASPPIEDVKSVDYTGVVIDKYRIDNHNVPYVDIKRVIDTISVDIHLFGDQKQNTLYDYLSIGDSIIKPVGSIEVSIIKKNKERKKFFLWFYDTMYTDDGEYEYFE